MSLSLGQNAYDAIQALKNNRDWQIFREALHATIEKQIHVALEVDPEKRLDATGYARALRDIDVALQLNEDGAAANRQYKTPIRNKPNG